METDKKTIASVWLGPQSDSAFLFELVEPWVLKNSLISETLVGEKIAEQSHEDIVLEPHLSKEWTQWYNPEDWTSVLASTIMGWFRHVAQAQTQKEQKEQADIQKDKNEIEEEDKQQLQQLQQLQRCSSSSSSISLQSSNPARYKFFVPSPYHGMGFSGVLQYLRIPLNSYELCFETRGKQDLTRHMMFNAYIYQHWKCEVFFRDHVAPLILNPGLLAGRSSITFAFTTPVMSRDADFCNRLLKDHYIIISDQELARIFSNQEKYTRQMMRSILADKCLISNWIYFPSTHTYYPGLLLLTIRVHLPQIREEGF